MEEGKFDSRRVARNYSRVFANAGLAVDNGDPTEFPEPIAHSSARYALVAALHHWAQEVAKETETALLTRLLEVDARPTRIPGEIAFGR